MEADLDLRAQDILHFWFGRVEETVVPTVNRARVWFGDSEEINAEIKLRYLADLPKAKSGAYDFWLPQPHGRLALIILLDQFSRHIYHETAEAFINDRMALDVCQDGIENQQDHALSLIERVFYYFPLLHSEDINCQQQSILAYRQINELALPETRTIYESFLRFANHHFEVIQRFGRFPQRNAALGRISTDEEIIYLKELEAE